MEYDVGRDEQEGAELVRRLKPDLAVIDVSLKDGSGLELLKVLKAEAPHLALLVLSMHEESLYAERSLRAGALGYVMKGEANERILKAIYSALPATPWHFCGYGRR